MYICTGSTTVDSYVSIPDVIPVEENFPFSFQDNNILLIIIAVLKFTANNKNKPKLNQEIYNR